MNASSVIEVEVDSSTNDNLHFAPLQRRVRGRFDYNRDTEPKAKLRTGEWPHPVPGQRIALDLTAGTGSIIEPLREPEARIMREKIERSGMGIAENETFTGIHVPTWLYWIKRAVESGLARIVNNAKLPDKIDGEPQLSFITRPRKNPNDRLAEAIDTNTRVLTELLKSLAKR